MFLDEQVQKLQRRVRNIEQNPRPEFLKCTKLRYQLELERYLHVLEAWKQGKPFAVSDSIDSILQAMGFEAQGYIAWGDRVSNPQKYYDIAINKLGFPDQTCDRTITALGLFLSGEVPIPRLMAARRIPCDPERWSLMAAAKFTGVLFLELARLNNNGDENIRCIADQEAALIEYAEKSVPGIKYDESKLIELMEADQQSLYYLRDTYELRKRVPCPISPQDSFRLMTMPSRYPNPARVVEYSKAYRDEMFERADKGIGGVREEKLRIAWLATGPYGRSTFDLLSKKGVSIPWFHYGRAAHYFGLIRDDLGDEGKYGRKLNPLEEMARFFNTNTWAGPSTDWVDPLIKACRDLKIDAVVDFLQVGCIPTINLKRITAQRLKEELGIPTLDLEGREHFATEAGTINMNKKLEEFIDMCIANKG
ncbi:MAG: 2-hydroxyacyl-CoA dehydratase [Chloroflexi bacterium]|nr:2-hydroxyacyl-CoA dehydratase [Chloroflexota bacterium]